MPFYTYESEDGEQIELRQNMSDMTDEIEKDGKLYKRVPEFGGSFILRGQGWASKGNATAGKVKKYRETGIAVDTQKAGAYESASRNPNPSNLAG